MECRQNVSSMLSLLTIEIKYHHGDNGATRIPCILSLLSSMRFQLLKFGFMERKQDHVAAMVSLFLICRGYLAIPPDISGCALPQKGVPRINQALWVPAGVGRDVNRYDRRMAIAVPCALKLTMGAFALIPLVPICEAIQKF